MKLEEIEKRCEDASSCCYELEFRRGYMAKLWEVAKAAKTHIDSMQDCNDSELSLLLRELEDE